MLIPNQKIEVKWHNSNIKYYKSLGYEYTEIGDSFFVSPEELTKGSRSKVGFICDYCQKVFYIPIKHYYHQKNLHFGDYKCIDCYTKHISEFSQNTRTEYIYEKVIDICKKYGYGLITPKSEMLNVNSVIKYSCPIHGVQSRRAHLFVYGEHICPKCNIDNKKLSIEEVSKYIEDRGSLLLNPNDYIGSRVQNLSVLCVGCGNPFITSYNSFYCTINGDAQICPDCWKNISKGERKIMSYLNLRGIEYVSQKTFEDCIDNRHLPFDFYIPKYKLVIEFDGKQHFIPTSFYSGISPEVNYKYIKKHDDMKTLYCFTHGINIIRIPYYDYDNLEEKLDNYFNSHEDIV